MAAWWQHGGFVVASWWQHSGSMVTAWWRQDGGVKMVAVRWRWWWQHGGRTYVQLNYKLIIVRLNYLQNHILMKLS